MEENQENKENIDPHTYIQQIRDYIADAIVGQEHLIDCILISLLCRQHLLIEGPPGLAKTLTITRFSEAIHVSHKRIQFTPDLLPSDLLGTLIFNPKSGEFSTKKGPLFSSIILADEVNRAPAKVQSALLEAMQERQITIDSTTYPLPEPFMVLATQNPIEQEGTYPLPEAQIDRFMMHVKVDYPNTEEELEILNRYAVPYSLTQEAPAINLGILQEIWKQVEQVFVSDDIKRYIVSIVQATRRPKDYGLNIDELIRYGVSPRATLALTMAAKARAFIQKKDYISPHDVQQICHDALRHRLILSFEAQAEQLNSDDIITQIINHLPIDNA